MRFETDLTKSLQEERHASTTRGKDVRANCASLSRSPGQRQGDPQVQATQGTRPCGPCPVPEADAPLKDMEPDGNGCRLPDHHVLLINPPAPPR